MDKKQFVYRALSYIYEDSESERIKKCRVLGRNLGNAIPADILDYLVEIAEKTPKRIIELYEGEDWKMHLFILDAVDRGVIRRSDGIYKYDDKISEELFSDLFCRHNAVCCLFFCDSLANVRLYPDRFAGIDIPCRSCAERT